MGSGSRPKPKPEPKKPAVIETPVEDEPGQDKGIERGAVAQSRVDTNQTPSLLDDEEKKKPETRTPSLLS